MTTVARKINREGVVLLGWGRAILLQLSHPLVAAGVGTFSPFDKDARNYVRRVHRTVGGMLAITFGTPEVARATIDRINGIHTRVRGRLERAIGPFPAGTEYSATDPALLLWVHATLVESMVVAYETLVGPLTAGERDDFCAEAAVTARQLGVPHDQIPVRFGELQAYLADAYASGRILVTDEARALAAALFAPPLGLVAVPLSRFNRLVTAGLLPPHIRVAYRLPWKPRHDRAFRVTMGLIRRMRWVLPPMLREWPSARVA